MQAEHGKVPVQRFRLISIRNCLCFKKFFCHAVLLCVCTENQPSTRRHARRTVAGTVVLVIRFIFILFFVAVLALLIAMVVSVVVIAFEARQSLQARVTVPGLGPTMQLRC